MFCTKKERIKANHKFSINFHGKSNYQMPKGVFGISSKKHIKVQCAFNRIAKVMVTKELFISCVALNFGIYLPSPLSIV